MAMLPATAQAALLQIDPSTSSIRYVRTVVVCSNDRGGAVQEGSGSFFCQVSVPATGALGLWDARSS
jgi:hypothetical protein